MTTIRGQILVSRTNEDPLLPRVYVQKRPPCVDSKRPRVYRHHAHMLKQMCAWCRHTRGRFYMHTEAFLNPHTVFSRFFSVPQHTHTHTNTHHDQQRHTPQNTTHTTPHRDGQRDTEKERQRKRDKTRQDKKREDETRREKK